MKGKVAGRVLCSLRPDIAGGEKPASTIYTESKDVVADEGQSHLWCTELSPDRGERGSDPYYQRAVSEWRHGLWEGETPHEKPHGQNTV